MSTRHLHPISTVSVAGAQQHIKELLASDTRSGVDEAVAVLSQHLAAGERVIIPAVRVGGDAFGRRIRSLETQLRVLQQANNGDSLARAIDVRRLLRDIRDAFNDYAVAESHLLDDVHERVSLDEWNDLVARWHDALVHAPTRPHPFTPHPRLADAMLFRVVGWWDHLLDTLDGRPVPRPRRSGPRRHPGRWGQYLLGNGPRDRD